MNPPRDPGGGGPPGARSRRGCRRCRGAEDQDDAAEQFGKGHRNIPPSSGVVGRGTSADLERRRRAPAVQVPENQPDGRVRFTSTPFRDTLSRISARPDLFVDNAVTPGREIGAGESGPCSPEAPPSAIWRLPRRRCKRPSPAFGIGDPNRSGPLRSSLLPKSASGPLGLRKVW